MSHQSIPRMERLNLTSSFWKPAAPRRVMAWDALRKPSLRIVQKGHKALIFCYFWIKPKVKSPSLEQRTQALHSMHFCIDIPSLPPSVSKEVQLAAATKKAAAARSNGKPTLWICILYLAGGKRGESIRCGNQPQRSNHTSRFISCQEGAAPKGSS